MIAEEHLYIDEYNFFDNVTIFLCLLFIIPHILYCFSDISIRYGNMTGEYLYVTNNFQFEASLLVMCLLIKPYETIRFYGLSTTYVPAVLLGMNYFSYLTIYDFTVFEGILFMPWRLLSYLFIAGVLLFVRIYVSWVVRKNEK